LISSARMRWAKTGPLRNSKRTLAGFGMLLEDVGAGDVGRHPDRGELGGGGRSGPGLASVETRRVLARPGTPCMRQWAAAEDGDEHFLNDAMLPDDDFAQLGFEGFKGIRHAAGVIKIGGVVGMAQQRFITQTWRVAKRGAAQ